MFERHHVRFLLFNIRLLAEHDRAIKFRIADHGLVMNTGASKALI